MNFTFAKISIIAVQKLIELNTDKNIKTFSL